MRLNDNTTWPSNVLDYLIRNYDLFLNREKSGTSPLCRIKGTGNATINGRAYEYDRARKYDNAIYGLRDILSKYTLRGYHCTRLHEREIEQIKLDGLQLPNEGMLHKRIQAIQNSGIIEPEIARKLIDNNQASEDCRANMIWFCFFEPHIAGQDGIERFFRSWGGEALYNSHEGDPVTGPILQQIGVPCIIEADVPIESLEIHSFLDVIVVRRFLVSHGLQTREPVDHEDRAKCPISAHNIRRVIRFPELDFIKLTRCDEWDPPLK